MTFSLDNRLKDDCFVLAKLELCHLLLMDNAAVPWFILVPETAATEIVDLPESDQLLLLNEINSVSGFVRNNFAVDKLNVAAIGNVVSQLHIHVVGRRDDDYCWPDVVWGVRSEERYTDSQVAGIIESVDASIKQLSESFIK